MIEITDKFCEFEVYTKLGYMAMRLEDELGGSTDHWILIIQKTRLFKNMLRYETGFWGEGVNYLMDSLYEEIGVPEKLSRKEVPSTKEEAFLQAEMVTIMHTRTNLTQSDVTHILRDTNLMEIFVKAHESFYTQGKDANLYDLQEILRNKGIGIEVYYE